MFIYKSLFFPKIAKKNKDNGKQLAINVDEELGDYKEPKTTISICIINLLVRTGPDWEIRRKVSSSVYLSILLYHFIIKEKPYKFIGTYLHLIAFLIESDFRLFVIFYILL